MHGFVFEAFLAACCGVNPEAKPHHDQDDCAQCWRPSNLEGKHQIQIPQTAKSPDLCFVMLFLPNFLMLCFFLQNLQPPQQREDTSINIPSRFPVGCLVPGSVPEVNIQAIQATKGRVRTPRGGTHLLCFSIASLKALLLEVSNLGSILVAACIGRIPTSSNIYRKP